MYDSRTGRFIQTDPKTHNVQFQHPDAARLGGSLGDDVGVVISDAAIAKYLFKKATQVVESDPFAQFRKQPAGLKSTNLEGKKASQIDRKAFKAEREAFWKAEAKNNPGKYNSGDLERMTTGRPPMGADGFPMELHHVDRTPEGGIIPMTRTDHRLGENYKKNHPD